MALSKFRNAYEISINSTDDLFEFTTDCHIKFKIYTVPGLNFMPGFSFSSDLIYFGFVSTSRTRHPVDFKIMNTIVNFIIDLFEDKNTILVFNYSPASGKHFVRKRYFNLIYKKLNDGLFHRTDFEFGLVDRASMIYRSDNDHILSIQSVTESEILEKLKSKNPQAL